MGRNSRQPHNVLSRDHRASRAVGILAAALAIPMLTSAAATATGALPSSTTLTASPMSSTVGTAVRLTATVSVFSLPGLAVLPTGSVAFTATNGVASAALGSATLGPFVLTACTATLTTTALPTGTTSVLATYQGDALVAPSSGSAPVTVAPNTNPGSSATVICYAGQPCDSGVVVVGNSGTTKLDVVADPSATNQTVTAALTGGQLHCAFGGRRDGDGDSDDGVTLDGDLATFSSTAADASKTVSYTGVGSVGARMNHEYVEADALYAGCYGAPHPFLGYVGGVYTNAQPGSTA